MGVPCTHDGQKFIHRDQYAESAVPLQVEWGIHSHRVVGWIHTLSTCQSALNHLKRWVLMRGPQQVYIRMQTFTTGTLKQRLKPAVMQPTLFSLYNIIDLLATLKCQILRKQYP